MQACPATSTGLPGTDPDAVLPGVVVTGTWTGVEEQMANRSAAALAACGFAALSFEFTGYGESSGQPGDYESLELKVCDIHHTVTYLTGRPGIDPARIGALGVCVSAGRSAVTVVTDPRGLSRSSRRGRAMPLSSATSRAANRGVADRMTTGHAARRKYETSGVDYVPAVSVDAPLAAALLHIGFYENPDRGG